MSMDDRDVMDGLLAEELAGGMTRADALKRGAAAGAGIYGLSAVFGAGTALAGVAKNRLTSSAQSAQRRGGRRISDGR